MDEINLKKIESLIEIEAEKLLKSQPEDFDDIDCARDSIIESLIDDLEDLLSPNF